MADLNALIAQGAQFRIPPPVDPMANMPQLMQMRAAQNQNALAQYQLSSAQREDAATNALNTAYQNAYDPATGKIDPARLRQSLASSGAGSKIPGVEKGLMELEKARLEQQKLQGDVNLQPVTRSAAEVKLLDDKLKQSRGFLDTLDPAAPDAGARYLAWHEANHADPIIGPALAARGANANQSRAAIEQAIAKGPQALANLINQSKLGAEKFMELNRATLTPQTLGGEVRVLSTPGLGGAATEVPGSRVATTITPGQLVANRIAQQQADTSAARLKWEQDNPGFSVHMTDQGPIAINNKNPSITKQITLDGQPLGKPLANIPATANKAMISNEQNLSLAKTALALAEGKTVGEVKGDIAATGWKGVLSDEMLQRMDPEGVNTRAYIADLGSMIVHDRSGAAVTASEMPRLKPFIPKSTDTAEAVQDKLKRFIRVFEQENNLYNEAYSKEQGYRPRSNANASTAAAPADKQALDWANANPTDPRAAQIKQRLGVR